MTAFGEEETMQIAFGVRQERNRELLATLLDDFAIVDVTGSVPDGTDLCLFDTAGFADAEDALADWQRRQRPLFAPAMLLSESSESTLWEEYADVIGDHLDAIQQIPAPKAAIRSRIESLLETRSYSQELSSERDFVERIFQTVPVAQILLDTDGDIVRANERAEDLFGLSKSSLSERTYDSTEWIIVDEEGEPIPSAELPFARVMASGEPVYGSEHGISRPEGGDAWLSIDMAPLRDADGEIEYLVASIDDITALRETKQKLRRTQQAIESSDHAVYITDTDGTIEYVNPGFEQITGYEQEMAVGATPSILNSSKMGDEYFEEMWRTITSGHTWTAEITNQRKDGNEYHAMQTVDPITDENGEIEGFVAIQTDISDHKDRLQQLRVMDRVLRHNLHNDMNVIRGYAELIEHEGEEKVATEAAKIVEYTDKLLELTDSQQRITEELTTEPNPASRDVVSLVDAAVDNLSTAHPGTTFHRDVPDQAAVSGTDSLESAFEEAIENAIVHTDQEVPEVWVTVDARGETVEVRIADTGPGIPEMDRRVVTGEHDIGPLYHGSGLGLWYLSWVIRRCDGQLAFEENSPRGTVVVISLQSADAAHRTRP